MYVHTHTVSLLTTTGASMTYSPHADTLRLQAYSTLRLYQVSQYYWSITFPVNDEPHHNMIIYTSSLY